MGGEDLPSSAQLPIDLRNGPVFAVDSTHWDAWFIDEHNHHCRLCASAPCLAARAPAPQPAGVEEEGEENDEAFKKVLEDSHLDELAQWSGLSLALAVGAFAMLEPESWPLASLVGRS